ncbi:MAG: YciI family protein [Sandaracinus sp.]|nr:YciI family protein [Sandaracinus sp.]MCB9633231.1 YciI family protein [Sandaracinus sp.]
MRVMVLVKATKGSESGAMPSAELLEAMGKYNEALVEAGILVGGEGLLPSALGKRVRLSGGRKDVLDGPFAETKELLAGFWIWKVASMDEALAWAKRCPDPMPGEDAELEIRPIAEMEDFGDAMTPENRAREERLRAAVEGEQ